MNCIFISNYFNHHQAELSESLNRITNGNFCFIEVEQMEKERINMGWGVKHYPYYVKYIYC